MTMKMPNNEHCYQERDQTQNSPESAPTYMQHFQVLATYNVNWHRDISQSNKTVSVKIHC